jgi:hypothetical protein
MQPPLDKQMVQHLEQGHPVSDRIHDTYVVDENNVPMTVVGTFGQDPDEKQKVSWRVWVVVALCALAQLQNTFISYVSLLSLAPSPP